MIFQSNQTDVFGLKKTKSYISMTHDVNMWQNRENYYCDFRNC